MIPDEAVEAALAKLPYSAALDTDVLRAMLEAAAPHILEDAKNGDWQDGYKKGHRAGYAEGTGHGRF